MRNIGYFISEELEKQLKSFLSHNLLNIKELKSKKIELDLLLIDINLENLDKKLLKYYELNIPVILLVSKEDTVHMRRYFVNNLIKDYVLRDNLEDLEELINFHTKCKPEFDGIFLKDCCRAGVINIEDIDYITYSSVTRESEFHLKDSRIFSVKKKFSDIERIQEKILDFVKLERGTIINISRVSFLNYKEEKIIFKNGGFIHLNKLKLKKVEEYLKYKKQYNFFL